MSGFVWVTAVFLLAVLWFVLRSVLRDSKASGRQGVMRTVALVAMVLLPAVAMLVYQARVEPGRADSGPAPVSFMDSTAAARPPASQEGLPPVENLLGKLERRLQREPDDAKGWLLLGRSYEYLGRSPEAEAAYAKARQLGERAVPAVAAEPARIRGRVMLDPALQSGLSGSETLFIFARALDGPRMPLAVVRKRVSDLPAEFELDDSMAMAPMMKLSGFSTVVVGARISVSGSAAASAGDLEGYSGVVRPTDTEPVAITIDQSVLGRDGVPDDGGRS